MRCFLLALLLLASPVTAATLAVYDISDKRYIYATNLAAVSSMASITKLMTAMVVLDAEQNKDELLEIRGKESSPRIRQNDRVSRRDLLELALVTSDNLAANTLLEHYPGGKAAGIQAMNAKAGKLKATQTRYVDASGLSQDNKTTAQDLVLILQSALKYPVLREMSAKRSADISVQRSNKKKSWWSSVKSYATSPYAKEHTSFEILVSKTGYTRRAGWCFATVIRADARPYVIITLGNATKEQRRQSLDIAVEKISTSHLLRLQDWDEDDNGIF